VGPAPTSAFVYLLCHTTHGSRRLRPPPPGGLGSALAMAFREPQLAANQQTGLRLACNAFCHLPLRDWAKSNRTELLDGCALSIASTSKAVRLAAATLLLNFSVLFSDLLRGERWAWHVLWNRHVSLHPLTHIDAFFVLQQPLAGLTASACCYGVK
jgi:PUL domain